MDDALRRAIETDLGARVGDPNGCTAATLRSRTRSSSTTSRRVFAKTHASPPPGFFTTEATGLCWLRAADAVAVPVVLAVSDDPPNRLVLEWIDEGRARSGTERDLGVGLAAHAPRGRAGVRPRRSADHGQSRIAERAVRDLAGVLRDEPLVAAGAVGARRPCARAIDDRDP